MCMMPASVWFTKQYPVDKWIDLINNFPWTYNIFLLGGKEDETLCKIIKEKSTIIKLKYLQAN